MSSVSKHKFTSAKADQGDATLVRPSNWNDEHSFTGGAAGDYLVRDTTQSDGANWRRALAVEDLRDYASLSAALTAFGSNLRTLAITRSETISSDLTIPSTVSLLFSHGSILTCSGGVTVTVHATIMAGRRQLFVGSGWRLPSAPVVYPEWWGAVGDGSTDDGGLINAAIASLCKCIEFRPVVYATSSQISLNNKVGIHLRGVAPASSVNSSNGTWLKWIGSASGTLMRCVGLRDSTLEGFGLTIGAGPSTLAAALDFDTSGASEQTCRNTISDVSILQRAGKTASDGSLTVGIRIGRAVMTGYLDTFTWRNVSIAGASSAGVSIESRDYICGQVFEQLECCYCVNGLAGHLNNSTGASFAITSGYFHDNTGTDIRLGNVSPPVLLQNIVSKNSVRFLVNTYGMSTVPYAVTIQGCYVSGITALAADGQFIQWGSTASGAPAGPLVLIGNQFYTGDLSRAATIGYAMINGVIVSRGNSFNAVSVSPAGPYVRNTFSGSTTAQITTQGDRGYDSVTATFREIIPAFLNLPVGDTQPDVNGIEIINEANTSPTLITNFRNGRAGQTFTMFFSTLNTTIQNNANIRLANTTSVQFGPLDVVQFTFWNGFWWEKSRSLNVP